MLKFARWGLVACAAALGASAFGADNWLPDPKPKNTDPKGFDPADDPVPSAFPALVLPKGRILEQREEAFEEMCPRLLSDTKLKIVPADTEPQKLLKARLQQGVLAFRKFHRPGVAITYVQPFWFPFQHFKDVRAVAQELWAERPKELVPWLEEIVIAAKNEERTIWLRVNAGASKPQSLNYAVRHRLQAETDLWKAKNPAKPAPAQPAKADKKPADGEWLDEKKLPPTLFPDVGLPAPDPKEKINPADDKWRAKRAELFVERCPRLSGKPGLKIEDGDTTPQKLLKARLHQGAIELNRWRTDDRTSRFDPTPLSLRYDCANDVLATVTELFAQRPKELVAWLEELLVEAKEHELRVKLHAEDGLISFERLRVATRLRLQVEGELWKAKNPK